MRSNALWVSAALFVTFWLTALSAAAGIFDDPVNLQVLPEDISADQLRATMIGFTKATGLRCSGCHVGEEGRPLAEFDFASDEKARKKTTRAMLRMVQSINADHLAGLDLDSRVTCVTCHRGVSSPKLTRDLLAEIAEQSGFEAMQTRYRKLRAEYFGTHSHDFSEQMLLGVATSLSGENLALAQQVVELNLEFFPQSFKSNFMMGRLLQASAQADRARNYYERALEIHRDPRVLEALNTMIADDLKNN